MIRKTIRLATIILIVSTIACTRTNVKQEKYDNGNLKSEKTYLKKGGKEILIKETTYHPNGKKFIEGEYKDELRDGRWASWYDNGQLWSEGNFVKGESHGRRTVYYQNGKKYYEGNFNMGKRSGIWTFYDENGVKDKEINYDTSPEMQ